ncbi:MAG: GNAT family N-acetyltransferase [Caldimonas sp.]
MESDSPGTTIRFAARADALGIAEMSRDFIEHGLGWSWTRERILRNLRHRDTNAIVAVRDADRAGFAIMKYGDEEAHLLLLAVKPAHRRCGVGSAMLAWLERSAEVAGVGRIALEARASNDAARAFYRRLGYAQAQVLPGYYGGRETSVRMVKAFGLSRTGAL